jgi:hypothetical protein
MISQKGSAMKQALLVLTVLLTVCATAPAAQQNDPDLVKHQQDLARTVATEDSPGGGQRRENVRGNNGDAPPSQEPKPAEDQKKKPPPVNKPPVEIKRPTIDASMVGYIDNAIVGSEVRIRFDAAFNDAFPDRAEFVYAKCGCYKSLIPPGQPGYDPNAAGPGPGIPKNVNYQILSFMGEYAVNHRFSAFFEIPFRWIQPQGVIAAKPGATTAFPNGAGISDVQAGLKFAVLASSRHYLTAQLLSYFPSGSAPHGLGTNHYSLEPALLYYQRLSDRFEIEGELGGWLPIAGSAGVPTTSSQGFAGNLFFYGIGPSYKLINGERFRLAPVIELVGWNVTGGQQTGTPSSPGTPSSASGINIVNLKIGARMGFGEHSSLYVGYGKALTSADWYDQIVRVEYRYSF